MCSGARLAKVGRADGLGASMVLISAFLSASTTGAAQRPRYAGYDSAPAAIEPRREPGWGVPHPGSTWFAGVPGSFLCDGRRRRIAIIVAVDVVVAIARNRATRCQPGHAAAGDDRLADANCAKSVGAEG